MNARKPDDIECLLHIREALDEVENFVDGYDEGTFEADRKTFLSTIKLIEIIGEAAYHVSAKVKDKFSHVPWRQIEGMRHRLVHEYYFVDVSIAWKVATFYSPQLREEIDEMIAFVENKP